MIHTRLRLQSRETDPFEILRVQGAKSGHIYYISVILYIGPFVHYGWLIQGSHRASATSVANRTGGVITRPTFMYCHHVT